MNKKITLLLTAFSFWCISSFAQLSGTYTIGGTAPDYATIQAATTALAAGVSGPVIFDIRPGTYTGKVSMGNVVGTSATNTITFQSENGDSSSVIITDPSSTTNSSNFTMLINGTDYLRFNQVTIERSGTDQYSGCIYIGSGSKRISFTNCRITAEQRVFGGMNSISIYIPLGGAQDSLVNFSNNLIEGNAYAFYFLGQSAATNLALPQITGNVMMNQGDQGIYLNNSSQALIKDNVITTNTTNTVFVGMTLGAVVGTSEISNNRITSTGMGGSGIKILSSVCTSGNEMLVKNNFISELGSTGTSYGIYLSGSEYINIYNNTVNVATNGNLSSCLHVEGNSANEVKVVNNIFVNTGGGSAIVNFLSTPTQVSLCDYNDLFTPNSLNIGTWGAITATDFADWQVQSGQDANSVSGDPQFTSSTNLHSGSPAVNDLGTPLNQVTDDIDGEARSVSTPDIGADEFTPLSDNIGLVSVLSPEAGCGDSATVVAVIIRNFGVNTQTGFDVTAEVSGIQTATLTETVSSSFATNQVDTIYFATTVNTYAGGTMNLSVYTSLGGDQDNTNDTLTLSIDFLDHPNAPTVNSPSTQCDNNVMLTAAHDSGDVLMWYDQAVDGSLLAVGDTFHTAVSGDTTFYVEAHHGSGTTGCLRITEIETNGTGDYVEIQNLSGVGFDATGYKVVCSDSYTDASLANTLTWDLGYLNAHEIQYRTDDASDNYWGNNLLWNPASNGWAMILDPNGAVVDFVGLDWDSTTIASMSVTVGSFTNIVIGSEWVGAGMSTSCSSTGITNHRMGTEDHNNAADWDCETATKGIQNPTMADLFMNCGIGACASPRVEMQVTVIPGITADLGVDTAVASPFSIQLSPGQGYTTYLWSTGETTDTITVTAVGTYWVTVSGANGCTFTDSINVTLIDAIPALLNEDAISFYPNPASTKLNIMSPSADLQKVSFRFFDTRGQEMKHVIMYKESKGSFTVDLSTFPSGMYFVQVLSNEGTITKRFNVVK